jgi:hypothetical protein
MCWPYIDTNNPQGMQLGRFKNRTPARFKYIYCTLWRDIVTLPSVRPSSLPSGYFWNFSDRIVEVNAVVRHFRHPWVLIQKIWQNFFISLLFHLFFLILTCSCQYSYNLMLTSNCMCWPYIDTNNPQGMQLRRFKNRTPACFEYIWQ